jgi:hypothetical protein
MIVYEVIRLHKSRKHDVITRFTREDTANAYIEKHPQVGRIEIAKVEYQDGMECHDIAPEAIAVVEYNTSNLREAPNGKSADASSEVPPRSEH